ncbi:MAG: hypothetical protein LBF72_01840 [Holosporales bacterium]|jgi:hypothetical protein|nr:hypothetical protein [Holosporales bacterium]
MKRELAFLLCSSVCFVAGQQYVSADEGQVVSKYDAMNTNCTLGDGVKADAYKKDPGAIGVEQLDILVENYANALETMENPATNAEDKKKAKKNKDQIEAQITGQKIGSPGRVKTADCAIDMAVRLRIQNSDGSRDPLFQKIYANLGRIIDLLAKSKSIVRKAKTTLGVNAVLITSCLNPDLSVKDAAAVKNLKLPGSAGIAHIVPELFFPVIKSYVALKKAHGASPKPAAAELKNFELREGVCEGFFTGKSGGDSKKAFLFAVQAAIDLAPKLDPAQKQEVFEGLRYLQQSLNVK